MAGVHSCRPLLSHSSTFLLVEQIEPKTAQLSQNPLQSTVAAVERHARRRTLAVIDRNRPELTATPQARRH